MSHPNYYTQYIIIYRKRARIEHCMDYLCPPTKIGKIFGDVFTFTPATMSAIVKLR